MIVVYFVSGIETQSNQDNGSNIINVPFDTFIEHELIVTADERDKFKEKVAKKMGFNPTTKFCLVNVNLIGLSPSELATTISLLNQKAPA